MLTQELYDKILATSADLLTANDELKALARDHAVAECYYRKLKATNYLQFGGTIPERNAQVDLVANDAKEKAMIAEGLHSAKLEEVRSIRAVLSALQTLTHTDKTEMELAGRYEPVDKDERMAPDTYQVDVPF